MGNNFTTTTATAGTTTVPGYPLATLRAAAELAAGGRGKIPNGGSIDLIITQAIERLLDAQPWAWRVVTTTLTLTADTNYVTLPADFDQVTGLSGTSSNRYRFQAVTMGELLTLRSASPPTTPSGQGQVWYYAIDATSQSAANVPPRMRIELYPTPNTTEAAAATLAYRKRITLPAGSDGEAAVVDIPPMASAALLALVRAEAAAVAVDGTPAGERRADRYERMAQQQLAALANQDGGTRTNLGSLIPDRLPRPRPFEGFPITIVS